MHSEEELKTKENVNIIYIYTFKSRKKGIQNLE